MHMPVKRYILLLFIIISTVFINVKISAQSDSLKYGYIYNNDTLIHFKLSEAKVIAPYILKNKRQKRKYTRLMRDIKKAYPLAKVVNNELSIVRDTLSFIEGKKAQKKFMKQYEKVVYKKYIDSLKRLNIRQGKLFIKLISRETGETGYELIKEYRGNFSAFFWQSMARLFSANLKSDYDPEEDAMIEDIIKRMEAGLI